MAVPTFNEEVLFAHGPRDMPEGPEVRYSAESLPGVDGCFVQLHGCGSRRIVATGLAAASLVAGSFSSAAAAHQALKQAIRNLEALADGRTIADYVGTDGNTYANCLLLSYEATAAPQIIRNGPQGYDAVVPATAVILHLDPGG
jgi:hypothetical protein